MEPITLISLAIGFLLAIGLFYISQNNNTAAVAQPKTKKKYPKTLKNNRTKPLTEIVFPSISEGDLINDKNEARTKLIDMLKTEGFCKITLSADTRDLLHKYIALNDEFMAKDQEWKNKWKGKPKYKDEVNLNRQVNKGYITVGEKEYLKLARDDPQLPIPDSPPLLLPSFLHLISKYELLGKICLETIGAAVHPLTGKEYATDKSLLDTIIGFTKKASSIAYINYHPLAKEDAKTENRTDKPTEETHFPSQTHCDTGLLTFITCTDIPALQIKDRITGEWYMPEKYAVPLTDAFIVIGKKLKYLQSDHEPPALFTPCVHRVALPYNTQRSTLLYFQDIPQ